MMRPQVIWHNASLYKVVESIRLRVLDVAESLLDEFPPEVEEVRFISDATVHNVGDFSLFIKGDELEPTFRRIRVNILHCRTLHDFAYTLLHEIRHAEQARVLGWEAMAEAIKPPLKPDGTGNKIEEDAIAWAVDTVRSIPVGRRRLLTGRKTVPSIYDSHRSLRAGLSRWLW